MPTPPKGKSLPLHSQRLCSLHRQGWQEGQAVPSDRSLNGGGSSGIFPWDPLEALGPPVQILTLPKGHFFPSLSHAGMHLFKQRQVARPSRRRRARFCGTRTGYRGGSRGLAVGPRFQGHERTVPLPQILGTSGDPPGWERGPQQAHRLGRWWLQREDRRPVRKPATGSCQLAWGLREAPLGILPNLTRLRWSGHQEKECEEEALSLLWRGPF